MDYLNIKKIFLLTIIVIIMGHSVYAEPNIPHPVAIRITAFDATLDRYTLQNECTVEFENRRNGETLNATCNSCFCLAELANIDAKEEDIITATSCLPNKLMCRTNNIKIGTSPLDMQVDFTPCVPNYNIFFSFKSLTPEGKESRSQNLRDLKEDEILRVDEITVIKKNNCSFEGWEIEFELLKPNGEVSIPFGIDRLAIPPLTQDESFRITDNGIVTMNESGKIRKKNEYISYMGDNRTATKYYFIRSYDLFQEGTWSINAWRC